MQFFAAALALAAVAVAAPVAEITEITERAAFSGGYCGLHAKLSYAYSSLSSCDVTVKDGKGNSLGDANGTGTSLFQKGGLPKGLTIAPNQGYTNPYITFDYNGQSWTTSSPQCKVGAPDVDWAGVAYIQLDCGFSC